MKGKRADKGDTSCSLSVTIAGPLRI